MKRIAEASLKSFYPHECLLILLEIILIRFHRLVVHLFKKVFFLKTPRREFCKNLISLAITHLIHKKLDENTL